MPNLVSFGFFLFVAKNVVLLIVVYVYLGKFLKIYDLFYARELIIIVGLGGLMDMSLIGWSD